MIVIGKSSTAEQRHFFRMGGISLKLKRDAYIFAILGSGLRKRGRPIGPIVLFGVKSYSVKKENRISAFS